MIEITEEILKVQLNVFLSCIEKEVLDILCLSQDVFVKKVTEVHEQINEQSMTDDYEFMTEEDMKEAKFSETLSV